MKNNFENIWNEFHSHLSGFVVSRIYDKEQKDDCVQEIFIKIYNGLDSLKDENKLESWMFQIARNTIADFNRQKIKSNSVALTDNDDQEEEIDNTKNTEVSNWIVPFIHVLPDKYSEAILDYEIKGLSQKDIAEKEGISLSAAKSRVQRGREKLKTALNDCCKFEIDKQGNILDYHARKKKCDDC